MKKTLLTLSCVFLLTQLHAQRFEISALAGASLFHYSGNSTTATSYILAATNAKQNYTNNPYGNKSGVSYGAAVQGQYITKGGFIAGLQAGYDRVRSKVSITGVYPEVVFYTLATANVFDAQVPASGRTFLQNQFINLNPYVGYRLKLKRLKIDLMPGFDIGFDLATHEYGMATTESRGIFKTDLSRTNHPDDIRLKFGTAISYNKWSITASYAHGIINYTSDLLNDSPVAYYAESELIRLGIGYRIF